MSSIRRRRLTASPLFSESNDSNIAVNAPYVFSFDERATPSEKYAPFNSLKITNNTDQDIKVRINQSPSSEIILQGGTIQTFDSSSVPAVRSLYVENVGSQSISVGGVLVEVQRVAVDNDDLLQKGVELLFGTNRRAV